MISPLPVSGWAEVRCMANLRAQTNEPQGFMAIPDTFVATVDIDILVLIVAVYLQAP